MAAAAINFNAKKNKAFQTASGVLPWDNNPSTDLGLTLALPANSTFPVFVLLQVQFMEQLNTGYYPLQNGAYNACAVIEVDTPSFNCKSQQYAGTIKHNIKQRGLGRHPVKYCRQFALAGYDTNVSSG